MDNFDMSKFNMSLQTSYDMAQDISWEFEENQRNAIRALEMTRQEQERKEQEKRDNLKRIADNSDDTVSSLKEINDLLRQNNELLQKENDILNEKLLGIHQVLKNLFELEKENGENQEELMKQALSLAVQIDMSIADNGKFDWKGALSNISTSGLFMGLQVYLHQHGLI